MKSLASIIAVLAFATTAFANPIPEAAPEADMDATLEKRADQYFTYWTETNFRGTKSNIKNPAAFKCYNLADPFQDTISSAGPTSGLVCTLWDNINCGGSGVTIRNPGISDLRTVNFNDRASSFQCAPA